MNKQLTVRSLLLKIDDDLMQLIVYEIQEREGRF